MPYLPPYKEVVSALMDTHNHLCLAAPHVRPDVYTNWMGTINRNKAIFLQLEMEGFGDKQGVSRIV